MRRVRSIAFQQELWREVYYGEYISNCLCCKSFRTPRSLMLNSNQKTLLTGATGYVGGRLLPLLEAEGYQVRYMTRRPEALATNVGERTEVVKGDVLDADSLAAAMQGVETAFYFVHSMGSKADFEAEDRQAAQNFTDSAHQAGVRRIVYLGGLGSRDKKLSKHLRSRQETGDVLRSSGVQVIELRASIVIGSPDRNARNTPVE